MSRTRPPQPSLAHRLAGGVGVALLLLLSVLGVRPDWHEALCHHETPEVAGCAHHHAPDAPPADAQAGDTGHEATGCVVTLFAQGHVLAALCLALWRWLAAARPVAFFPADVVAPVAFAHEWPQGRGPPAA